ncbi:hypothetical protein IMCC9480_581 [Oxalobacteraceae bacterium IMCC9480]|nr:hypothetical protein IMCC9480_581 [Oxalobacteraceae bacterium IMCC9480]
MLHSTLAVSLEGLPIGGYLNSKHDRPPGATVLWRGFHALHEISSMYLIMRKNE